MAGNTCRVTVRWPGCDDPLRTATPLRRQCPVQSITPLLSEQLSRIQGAFVDVIVDAENAEGHTVQPLQDLVFHRRDVKHPKLCIVYPLTITNLNPALDDADIPILYLPNELNGFSEKQVVVPFLVADVPPIF